MLQKPRDLGLGTPAAVQVFRRATRWVRGVCGFLCSQRALQNQSFSSCPAEPPRQRVGAQTPAVQQSAAGAAAHRAAPRPVRERREGKRRPEPPRLCRLGRRGAGRGRSRVWRARLPSRSWRRGLRRRRRGRTPCGAGCRARRRRSTGKRWWCGSCRRR